MKALRVFLSLIIFYHAEAIPTELGLDTTIGTTAAATGGTSGTSGTEGTGGTEGTEGTEGCKYIILLHIVSLLCRDDGDWRDRNHGDDRDWRQNVITIDHFHHNLT